MSKSTYNITRFKSGEAENNDEIISDIQITYGFTETKFGECLVGLKGKENTICFLSFMGPNYPGIDGLKRIFPKAALTMNNNLIANKLKQLFEESVKGGHIELLLKGTDFEIRVWEHLVKLKRGSTTTYEEVAKDIGHPNAVRAVANAIGKNNISYFVPCHRVIAKRKGIIGGYKWGVQRKKQMLQDEEKAAKQTILDKFWKKKKTASDQPAIDKSKTVSDEQAIEKSKTEEIQH
ncbi:unnamed protein product [Phaedon cochleariae]|uniref:Methylated-DNA--protein-cysteine methyltransferase n=1 Tax=Phaedon cochleariae TaxID=80249 RepID=A0A9P0DEN4_PHACE|nr:unnamed protein product [Phaedon cochleariae]